MLKHIALGCLLFSFTNLASAMGDDFFSTELPMVMSASRLTQSVLTSPSAVTVIDKAMIEASGFVEIADLLRLVPGFQVANADGKDIAVTYHGDGWEFPGRLQVLINGRSTYIPALSAVDWSSIGIHITDIERIEVVRGPAASAYGSNSFSAAINIITKPPELDDTFTLSARTGNVGERELLLRHSNTIGDMHYRISASTREHNGFSNVDDGKDFNNVSFHGQTELNNLDVIDLYLTYTKGETGADYEPGLEPRDRHVKATSGHLKWQHFLSDHEDLKLNFYHNYRDENDDTDSILLSEVFNISPAAFQFITGAPDQTVEVGVRTNKTTKTDVDLQYSWLNDSGLQYVVGAGMRYDTLISDFFTRDRGRLSDTSYRAYGNVQLPIIDRLTMNMGAIYEHNQITSPHLSPRVSLNLRVSEQQSFRIAVSRAYRIPSLLEANLDANLIISNGLVLDQITATSDDLQAERITSFELGYLGKLSTLPISWEFKAYKEEIEDVAKYVADKGITDFVDNKVRVLMNVGEYKTYGIEGEITYRPEQKYFVKFQFNRGHSAEEIITGINPERIKTSNERAPRESYGLLASIPLHDWQFNLGVYRVDGIQWGGRGDYVDAYTRVDASVIKHFMLSAKRTIKLKLAAQNFTNEYEEFKEQQFFKSRFYAEISFTEF